VEWRFPSFLSDQRRKHSVQLLARKPSPAHHYADDSFQVTHTLKRVFFEEQQVGPFFNVNRPELTGLAQLSH
jgi:hypothetical protein